MASITAAVDRVKDELSTWISEARVRQACDDAHSHNRAGRCPFVMDRCRIEEPPFGEVTQGRWSACWLHQ